MEKQLAKITSAKLEIKERGVLNFWIFVEYEDGGFQGIGGIALDQYDELKKIRVGTSYGCEMIRRILICLDVDDFNEMTGKIIWVHGNGSGFSFEPMGIQLLNVSGSKKDPLIFSDVYDEFKVL